MGKFLKMLRFVIVCLITIVTSKCAAKDLPSFLPRCYMDDPKLNDCLLTATRTLKPLVRKGIPEIKLPSFNPLITEYGMTQTDHPIVNYTMYFWNFTMYGLDDYEFKEIRFDPKTLDIRGRVLFPPTPTIGICDVTGDYLTIHNHGKGPVVGQYESSDLRFHITGEKVTRKSKEYYNPKEVRINLTIEDFKVNVTDLFGDNTEIGILATTLINASSKLVIDETAPVYARVIEAMWLRYLQRLTKKYPLEKLLPYSP